VEAEGKVSFLSKLRTGWRTKKQIVQGDCSNSRQVLVVAEALYPRVVIEIDLLDGRNNLAHGNEAWLLDIVDDEGCPLIDWTSCRVLPPIAVKALDEGLKPALLFQGSGGVTLDLPQNVQLVFFKHAWSGMISVRSPGQLASEPFDLFSSIGAYTRIPVRDIVKSPSEGWHKESETQWLLRIKEKRPEVLAILNPHWRGVRSATENLVPDCLMLEDDLNRLSAARFASLILETGCKKFLIGGFPLSYEFLIEEIKQRAPECEIFVFWLASFLQSNEDYVWHAFKVLDRLNREGLVDRVALAKKGMENALRKTGLDVAFVASYVRTTPKRASVPDIPGVRIGIWALAPIWRKTPYAMLAAAAMVENAMVFMVGQDSRAIEFAEYFRLPINVSAPVPQNELPERLAKMHINLYVTLSECSPMLPLESLSVGTPCLLGPNSHLFEDHSYLHSRLVVPYPDRSDIIARMIEQALAERERIIEAYIDYAPRYRTYAQKTLADFLNGKDVMTDCL
jgi:hypothetical protein